MEIPSAVQYERDDRSDSFRTIGDIMVSVAKYRGVTVDETTAARWSDVLGLLREFDTMVDDQGISTADGLALLADFSSFQATYPSLGPTQLGQATHDRMVKRVETILGHGDVIRTTTDPDEFIHHRLAEVDHTAELLADCAAGDTTTQPGFYTRFMPTVRAMGQVANIVDTVIDYRGDKRDGKHAIEWSGKFAKRLGAEALRAAKQSEEIMFHREILRQFWAMGTARIAHRRRVGTKPYSSLRQVAALAPHHTNESL